MEKEQKKIYIAPELMELRFERQAVLLGGSDPDPETPFNGEFGFAPQQRDPLA